MNDNEDRNERGTRTLRILQFYDNCPTIDRRTREKRAHRARTIHSRGNVARGNVAYEMGETEKVSVIIVMISRAISSSGTYDILASCTRNLLFQHLIFDTLWRYVIAMRRWY